MAFDWTQYAVGGAQRPDSFTGMKPQLRDALQQLFSSAPPEIASGLKMTSGYRSPERQAVLYEQALKKYGSPEIARKWVAPPGNSQHNHGGAGDFKFLSNDARKWAHENAGKYGLTFPLSNEDWHVELAGGRGQPVEAPQPQAAPIPQQIAANQTPQSPQESGSPAPALPAPINVSDRPIGQPQDAPQAPPPGILAALAGEAPKASQGGMDGIIKMLMAQQMEQSAPQPAQLLKPMQQTQQNPAALAEFMKQFLQSRTA